MDFDAFYTIALKFLTLRPRSEQEVYEYLRKKNAPIENIKKIVRKLNEQKFLNDEAFTRWWISQRTEFHPKSTYIIKLELKQKGVSSEIIDSVLAKNRDNILTSDLEKAKKIISQRISRFKGFSEYELLQKLGPYLQRRGFSYGVIKEALTSELKKEYNTK